MSKLYNDLKSNIDRLNNYFNTMEKKIIGRAMADVWFQPSNPTWALSTYLVPLMPGWFTGRVQSPDTGEMIKKIGFPYQIICKYGSSNIKNLAIFDDEFPT